MERWMGSRCRVVALSEIGELSSKGLVPMQLSAGRVGTDWAIDLIMLGTPDPQASANICLILARPQPFSALGLPKSQAFISIPCTS
jgi:hypothetical protein